MSGEFLTAINVLSSEKGVAPEVVEGDGRRAIGR